jgi:hypothetical protein
MTHTFEFSLISPQRSNNVPANEVATVAICEGIGIFSEVVLLDLTAWMSSGRRQPTKVARASVRPSFPFRASLWPLSSPHFISINLPPPRFFFVASPSPKNLEPPPVRPLRPLRSVRINRPEINFVLSIPQG